MFGSHKKTAFGQSSRLLALLAVGLYIAFYFGYVWHYATNIPFIDDYTALLNHVIQFGETSIVNQVKSLFLPHNEHILWATRAVGLIQFGLVGRLDFKSLVVLGNLLLVVELGLIFWFFRESLRQAKGLGFVLIALLFLQPQYSATSFWAMAVWSNVLVIVLASLTFISLVYRWPLWSSLILAAFCLFSNGNGMMVLPAGLWILWVQRRSMTSKAIWICTGVVLVGLYFYLLRTHGSQNTFLMGKLWQLPFNILAFLGATAALGSGIFAQVAAVCVGALLGWVSVKTLWEERSQLSQETLFLLALMSFVVLTACSVALFRSDKGIEFIIGSRYKHYSALAVVLVLMLWWRRGVFFVKSLNWQGSLVVILLVFTALAYLRDIGYRLSNRREAVATYHNLLHNQTDLYGEEATPQMIAATRAGHEREVYVVPKEFDLAKKIADAVQVPIDLNTVEKYEAPDKTYEKEGKYLAIEEANLSMSNRADEAMYLLLRFDGQDYVLPAYSRRNGFRELLRQKTYFQKGIEAKTLDTFLPKTPHQTAWLYTTPNVTKLLIKR